MLSPLWSMIDHIIQRVVLSAQCIHTELECASFGRESNANYKLLCRLGPIKTSIPQKLSRVLSVCAVEEIGLRILPGSGSWADVVLCCNRGTSSRSRSANIPPSLRKRLTPSRCIRKTSLQVDEVLPSIVQCHRLGPANQALFQDLISLYYLYQRLTKTCIGTEGLSVSDGKREDT